MPRERLSHAACPGERSLSHDPPVSPLRSSLPVGALLALLTWEVPQFVPRIGFDNSWLTRASSRCGRGLDYGRDVVFVDGPLGFLAHPLIVSWWTGAASFAYALVAQVGAAAVVASAASRVYGRVVAVVMAFAALSLTLLLSDITVYLAFLFAVWLLERDDPPDAVWLVPLCAGLAAVETAREAEQRRALPRALPSRRLAPASPGCSRRDPVPRVVRAARCRFSGSRPARRFRHCRAGCASRRTSFSATRAPPPGAVRARQGRVLAVLLVAGLAALLVPRLRNLPRSRWIPLLLDRSGVRLRVCQGRLRSRGRARSVLLCRVCGGRACVRRGRASHASEQQRSSWAQLSHPSQLRTRHSGVCTSRSGISTLPCSRHVRPSIRARAGARRPKGVRSRARSLPCPHTT